VNRLAGLSCRESLLDIQKMFSKHLFLYVEFPDGELTYISLLSGKQLHREQAKSLSSLYRKSCPWCFPRTSASSTEGFFKVLDAPGCWKNLANESFCLWCCPRTTAFLSAIATTGFFEVLGVLADCKKPLPTSIGKP